MSCASLESLPAKMALIHCIIFLCSLFLFVRAQAEIENLCDRNEDLTAQQFCVATSRCFSGSHSEAHLEAVELVVGETFSDVIYEEAAELVAGETFSDVIYEEVAELVVGETFSDVIYEEATELVAGETFSDVIYEEATELVAGETFSDVIYEEEFIMNSRGLKLFTCRWLPANREAKALICLCHGYGMECSIFMKDTAMRLAKEGYAVFCIDYEGHGRSTGLHGYVKSFQELTNDCAAFFNSVTEKEEYKRKARFLYGESMGGAVALLIHRNQPGYWSGAVLVAPMCKLADDVKPHPLVISILHKLSYVIPTWKIIPTQDIISLAFRDPQKRQEIRTNPYAYQGKPRLKTGIELLMTSIDIEKRLDEVTIPFLLLHGEDDKVTDPSVSKLLHDSARSLDKTFKLYPDMWHGLTCGETPEHIELVFSDIISWLNKRSPAGCPTKIAS